MDDTSPPPSSAETPVDDGPGLGLDLAAADAANAPRAGGDAYRVLARKYRPGDFDALIGQEAMVRTLSNAFESGRIAHAFMLTGVRGVGKTTTARIVAKGLNCIGPDGTGGPTVKPCGVCEPCRSIAASRSVDVLEMDAASNTGIDDVREIIEGARYAPASARYKVYIVDEVHMLSKAAFNGLLKTLEEPPPHVKFIFATTEVRKVPVTVLSRCQRFDLRRVEADRLVDHLAWILSQEGAEATTPALGLIARAAEGSVRDALSLLDQALAHGIADADDEAADDDAAGAPRVRIAEEQVRAMLGLADRARVFDLFDKVMGGDAARALTELADQYDAGADPVVILQDMLELTHWLTRIKLIPEAAADTTVPEGERRRGAEMAGKLDVPTLSRAWQMLLKGLAEARDAPAPLSSVEMVLIRLAYLADLQPPEDLLKALKRGAPTGPPSHTAAPPSAPPAATPSPAPAPPGDGGAAPAGSPPTASSAPTASSSHTANQAPGAADEPPPWSPDDPTGGPPDSAFADDRPFAEGNLSPAPRPERAEAGRAHLAVVRETPPGDFDGILSLIKAKRDIVLQTDVEIYVHPVRVKPGLIEFRPEPDAPPDLAARLRDALTGWTGMAWSVSLSNEEGGETVREAKQRAERERREEVMNDPLVKAVFAAFPDADIKDIVERAVSEADTVAAGGDANTSPDDADDED
jgi:DNA polymerase-3 subunit gamma/tau